MSFIKQLDVAINKNNSLVCVGLDPDLDKIPEELKNNEKPLFEFNKSIIDATHDLVCAYKPNTAFYEALGADGIEQLHETCDYIKQSCPEIPIILDYKRGDIGNTNAKYAQFAFGYLKVDAVTLHSYQGIQELDPYFSYEDKGIFIWVKGSNKGSEEFQNLIVEDKPLYRYVTEAVISADKDNAMLIVGATYPEELKKIRDIAGDNMPILVPGIGAQGGDLQAMLKAGLNAERKGLIINSSRGVIYNENPRKESENLRDQINNYR